MSNRGVFYCCYLLILCAYVEFGVLLSQSTGNSSYVSAASGVALVAIVLITLVECFKGQPTTEARLRGLINGRQSMPIAELAERAHLPVSKVSELVDLSGLLAVSTDGSTVLNLEELVDDLLSHADSTGKIDAAVVCAHWSLDVRFVASLAKKSGKSIIENQAGELYSRPALARILEAELDLRGEFDAVAEAKKRGFSYSGGNAASMWPRGSRSVLITSSGVILLREVVVRKLMNNLSLRGVLDLSFEFRKLGIDAATGSSLAGYFSEDGLHEKIPGTSLIAKRYWLSQVRRAVRERGTIDLSGFAESLGISRTSLLIVLSSYVEGFVDEPTGTFYTRGTPVRRAPMPTQSQQHVVTDVSKDVQVLRGGEFVGNRLRYKVKVLNNSRFVITDVTVSLVSYPRETLKIEGPIVKTIAKIDPGGFNSPLFEFMPTRDCVKGEVIAMVCYVDYEGKPHTATTEPFTVRAVCDLLIPETITPEQFELRLADFSHGEMSFKVVDWTPEEMRSKALQVLEKLNFCEVTSNQSMVGQHVESKTTGWARGKYTKKNLGVELTITGRPGVRGATCTLRMSGEDEAMIMPAIDEMSQNLTAWLCPMCGGDMPEQAVGLIREGKQSKCPFCGVTLGR